MCIRDRINVYMTFEIVFVLLSLLGMMAALIADKMRPGMVLFSVVVLFPVSYTHLLRQASQASLNRLVCRCPAVNGFKTM